ncbi:MAG: aminomethyl-transferring glycine dehydrogenase subunit GcvPB [Firmicutes bacterium]|nr:aminomethyl-transferring glycine dehydrogenase subunit GcvPB [Bacillota bacterium]
MRREKALIFELGSPGREGFSLPASDVPEREPADLIPSTFLRERAPDLPQVSEGEAVRHYVELSRRNFGVDSGFYPLGSCTMKYNPKINEDVAALPGFAQLHPYQPEELSQGMLQMLYELDQYLAELTGMDRVTVQPAAGAQGELTGLMLIRAYHEHRGDKRRTVICPDSAHGTNPASAAMSGYKVLEIPSTKQGLVDVKALEEALDEDVAALMLTNPNTLGLFEVDIPKIAELVHKVGGLLYYDGANLNAIMGHARPGDMGFDVVHLNLHKTLSTPHGGGGPGSGAVGVKKDLVPFLPVPVVEKVQDKYSLNYDLPHSIGKVQGFYGNVGVALKAYTYMLQMGAAGLKQASSDAVLNANYVRHLLKNDYWLPHDYGPCKHEFVLSAKNLKDKYGVRTLDIAKRLIDHGVHPPTVYFPLIVDEALMIEPTETESKQTLDEFIEVMKAIAKEAATNPEVVLEAPHTSVVGRLDEVKAARQLVLRRQK